MPKTTKERLAAYERILAKQDAWRKEHTENINVRLNIETDADILEWLSRSGNKSRAIKSAIREAIAKEAK